MALTLLMLGKIAFAATGVAVGVSLVRRVLQEGRLGLPALASSAIFVGGLGLVLIPIGTALGESTLGWWTAMLGEWAMRVGIGLLAVFVWRVFRPTGKRGAIAASICITALAGTLIWDLSVQPGWWPYDISLLSAYANQIAIALPLAWSCLESFLSWRRQHRRIALGLGDPLIEHRFALWTLATLAFTGICILAIVAGHATRTGFEHLASTAQTGRALLYFVISVTVWTGMFSTAARRETARER